MKTYKLKLPIGELFDFLKIDLNLTDVFHAVNRNVEILSPTGYVKILAFVTKTGNIKKYTLKNGDHISCDEKHLVKQINGTFKWIKDSSHVIVNGEKQEILKHEHLRRGIVYDVALDNPHEYLTSSGITCHNTSLAKLLVKQIPCDHLYINASDERTIDTIREKIVGFAATVSFEPLRVIILDESDFFPALSQAALRNVIETYSIHTRFILTANYIERITDPIRSRCGGGMKIEPPSKDEVGFLLAAILDQEKITYKMEDIAFIVNSYFPDIRQIINFAQQNTADGKLAIAVESCVEHDYREKLLGLLKTPRKAGIFNDIRQLVADAHFSNYDEVYRYLFDKVNDFSKGKEPQVILELADAIYQSSLVFEKEITFVAMMQKLLKALS